MGFRSLIAMGLLVFCAVASGCGSSAEHKAEADRSAAERKAAEDNAVAEKKALADKEATDKTLTPPDSGVERARQAGERYLKAARLDFNGNEAGALLTEAFRKRLKSLRGPEIPIPYEYDRWEIIGEDIALDRRAVTFEGKAHVTALRQYQDIGPGGLAFQKISSGGLGVFSLRLTKGKDGSWMVDDFGFDRSSRQIIPVEATPEDVKEAVYDMLQLPEVIRGNFSPKQLADELKTKAWAFRYTGGPLQCRVLAEEVGQKTYGSEGKFSISDNYLKFKESEGHICLWMRQVHSERMKQNGLKAGKGGSTEGALVGSYSLSGRSKAPVSFPFLWYHWEGATFKERKLEAAPKEDEEVTILEVEATETRPLEGKVPRKVKLTMTAKPLPLK